MQLEGRSDGVPLSSAVVRHVLVFLTFAVQQTGRSARVCQRSFGKSPVSESILAVPILSGSCIEVTTTSTTSIPVVVDNRNTIQNHPRVGPRGSVLQVRA